MQYCLLSLGNWEFFVFNIKYDQIILSLSTAFVTAYQVGSCEMVICCQITEVYKMNNLEQFVNAHNKNRASKSVAHVTRRRMP